MKIIIERIAGHQFPRKIFRYEGKQDAKQGSGYEQFLFISQEKGADAKAGSQYERHQTG